jgi:hypothetical protein
LKDNKGNDIPCSFSYITKNGELKTITLDTISTYGNCIPFEDFAQALNVPNDIYLKYKSYIE